MDERVVQFRVGVLALATIIITAVLVLLFRDRPTFFRTSKTMYVDVPTARGVAEGTRVLKRGVLIGRVTNIAFVGEGVRLTLDIDGNVILNHGDVPVLQNSILGDAVLEFIPPTLPAEPSPTITPGEFSLHPRASPSEPLVVSLE